MKMTIDEIIKYLPAPMCSGSTIIYPEEQKYYEAHDTAVNILQKYQKIEEAYKKYLNDMVTNIYADGKFIKALREVLEDGKTD